MLLKLLKLLLLESDLGRHFERLQRLSFPYEVENPSLSLFFSSLVCIHLGYLRTAISGIDQASSFHLTHIFYHSPSYHSRQFFMLFDL